MKNKAGKEKKVFFPHGNEQYGGKM